MKFAEKLKLITTDINTDTLRLEGGAGGWTLSQLIRAGGASVGDTGVQFIVDDGIGNWEIGTYTITSAVRLTRTGIVASSNNGAAVVFLPGVKIVTAVITGSSGGVASVSIGRPVRAFIWGDSITDLGQFPNQDPTATTYVTTTGYTTRSWYARAAARLSGRLNIVGARGRSGKRLDQIATYFETDVLPYKPNLLVLEGASNDIDAGPTYNATTAWAAIMAIYAKCQANGMQLLYVGTTAGSTSVSQRGLPACQELAQLRAVALGASQRLPGFLFFDWYPLIADYTATAANMTLMYQQAGMTFDTTHPSGLGGRVLGDGLAVYLDSLPGLLPKQPFRTSANTGTTSGNPFQLVANNLLGGTAGTLGAGASGTVPDRFDLRRSAGTGITGAASVGPRTDGGPGRAVTIAVANSASDADVMNLSFNVQNGFSTLNVPKAAGTTCRAYVDIAQTVTSGVINAINIVVKPWNDIGASNNAYFAAQSTMYRVNNDAQGNGTTSEYLMDNTSFSGTLITPEFVLPSGTDHVSIEVRISTSVGAVASVVVMNPEIISDQWTAMLPAGSY